MSREGTFPQFQCIGKFTDLRVWEITPKMSFDECFTLVASIKNDEADRETMRNMLIARGAKEWVRGQGKKGKRKRTPAKKSNDEKFQAIFNEAHAAGIEAVKACQPTPMVVGSPSTPLGNDIDPTKQMYHVSSGVCGFAWVWFRGNKPWGRWMKKQELARPAYQGGLDYSPNLMNYANDLPGWGPAALAQSMELKMAYCDAFAKVLTAHDIECSSRSRMD